MTAPPMLATHGCVLSHGARRRLFKRIRSLFEAEDRRLARLESILADHPHITSSESEEIAHLLRWRCEA
jgi:hypothetical protein